MHPVALAIVITVLVLVPAAEMVCLVKIVIVKIVTRQKTAGAIDRPANQWHHRNPNIDYARPLLYPLCVSACPVQGGKNGRHRRLCIHSDIDGLLPTTK